MNKTIALMASCLLASTLQSAISPETDFWSIDDGGLKKIYQCNPGEQVFCAEDQQMKKTTIKKASIGTVDSFVHVVVADNSSVLVSCDQKFFLPEQQTWVEAQNLQVGDKLASAVHETIAVKKADRFDHKLPMITLELNNYHNYFVGKAALVVHNGPVTGFVTYWGVKAVAYTGICVGTTTAIGVTTGAIAASAPVSAVGGAVGAAIGTGTASTGAVVAGAGIAAGGATAGGSAAVAGTVAASSIQSAGIIASTAAAVEGAAFSAGVWATACPFLP